MQLAEMCKEIRRAMRISQCKLAEMVGTNQTEISFIERGFIPESKEKVEAIHILFRQNCV